MNGIGREYEYPVLADKDTTAVTDEEKADMSALTFVQVCCSNNITIKG